MKQHICRYYCIILMFSVQLTAQEGIHNYGNLQLHKNGSLGFHADFFNNGGFDKNLGLIGFYHSSESLALGGAFSPVFHDLELGVENGLYLDIGIRVNRHLNFIYGDIVTEMDRKYKSVNLIEKADYVGYSENSKIREW